MFCFVFWWQFIESTGSFSICKYIATPPLVSICACMRLSMCARARARASVRGYPCKEREEKRIVLGC